MQKIKYEFNDGTTKEIEVTNEFYEQYQAINLQEKHNTKRETRRHISLDYLSNLEITVIDRNVIDPLTLLLQKECSTQIKLAISKLTKKQKILLYKVVFENMGLREIARQNGVAHQPLSRQLASIYRKLKKFL